MIIEELISKVDRKIDTIRISLTKDPSKARFFEQKYSIKPKITSIASVSELEQIEYNEIKKIAENQRIKTDKKGYDLILIRDFNFSPRIDTSEYVKIVEELLNDVPQEEMSTERMVYTEERLEQDYTYWINEGMECLTYVAIMKDTTIPVGFTQTNLSNYHPEVATQFLTGVIKIHRGKGLGLALKYQMLLKLLEQKEVKYWFTSNARINAPMRRINEIMGYRYWLTRCGYEIEIDKLK